MTPPAFHTDKRAPEGMLGRKQLPADQSGAPGRLVSPRNLRCQRQEQFIQELLDQEVPQHLWPAFNENDLAWAHLAYRLDNCPGMKGTSLLHGCDLHGWGNAVLMETSLPLESGHDQHRHLPGLKERQVKVEFAVCGHDDVERRPRLAQIYPKMLVDIAESRIDIARCPTVMGGDGPQGAGPDDHCISHST